MGALRDSARSFGDELGDYYVAALEFIDPELAADSPLSEILAAAKRRRRKLGERPLYQAEDELNALDEALHFVQRVRSDLPSITTPDPDYIDVDVDTETGKPEGITPSELWARAMSPTQAAPPQAKPATAEVAEVDTAQPRLFPPAEQAKRPATRPAAVKPAPASKLAGAEWHIPADRSQARQQAGTVPAPAAKQAKQPAPNSKPEPGVLSRSLREVMDRARTSAAVPTPVVAVSPTPAAPSPALKPRRAAPLPLPEQVAWPTVAGTMLIAWQAGLAAFAAWTATRFFAWPRPGIGYDLSSTATTGLFLLALATALIIGRIAWAYRRRTRCLALIAHLSALVLLANIGAWSLAAKKLGALIDGPGTGHYVMLGLGWGVAWLVTGIHDAVVRRSKERREDQHGPRRV